MQIAIMVRKEYIPHTTFAIDCSCFIGKKFVSKLLAMITKERLENRKIVKEIVCTSGLRIIQETVTLQKFVFLPIRFGESYLW